MQRGLTYQNTIRVTDSAKDKYKNKKDQSGKAVTDTSNNEQAELETQITELNNEHPE